MKCSTLHLKEYYPVLGTDERDPKVDLYLPYNMSEMKRDEVKRPCLVICPGGAYRFCSQRESEPVALHFLTAGFNVFILTYSTAPHRFPTQLCEVAAVMELIYKNSEEWNCDVSRVAIMGFSAGGHLAAHYSTSYDCPAVRAVFPKSKPVQASILGYPVITADPNVSHQGSFNNLLGHQPEGEELDAFSCDRCVTDKTPPAFLWHTAADGSVPVANSLLYAGALAAHHIPFELHVYPFGGHGLSTVDRHTNNNLDSRVARAAEWLTEAKCWLEQILD